MAVPIPSNNRDKLSNGRLHAPARHGGVDLRTRAGRRWRYVYEGLLAEFGREPSPSEQTRLRVAANLTVRVDDLAARLANGERVDPGDVTMLSSELRRVLVQLGLASGKGTAEPASLADLMADGA